MKRSFFSKKNVSIFSIFRLSRHSQFGKDRTVITSGDDWYMRLDRASGAGWMRSLALVMVVLSVMIMMLLLRVMVAFMTLMMLFVFMMTMTLMVMMLLISLIVFMFMMIAMLPMLMMMIFLLLGFMVTVMILMMFFMTMTKSSPRRLRWIRRSWRWWGGRRWSARRATRWGGICSERDRKGQG